MQTLSDISNRLAGQALKVAQMLLPAGKMEHGREWVCGDVTGKPGDSLKVTITGAYAGQWRDWSTDSDKGDLIDLWRLTKNLTASEAVRQVKDYLGITDPVKMERKTYRRPPDINSVELHPEGQAMKFLKDERKLTEKAISAYLVLGCPEKRCIVFPSYSPSGELLNRSYRTLGANKRVWQDSECAPSLFGWQAVPEQSYRDRKIILSEGQIDAMTWWQWGFPALSIPNGAGMSWIEHEWENLEAFETIYIAFDADGPGAKFTETVVNRLGKHRCLIITTPKKDANDCLKAGYTKEDAAEWVASAKTPTLKKLVLAKDLQSRIEQEMLPKPEPFTLPFLKVTTWETTQEGFWYRPGEVTIVGGYSSAGKTTFLNFLMCNLLADTSKMFVASLEMPCAQLLLNLIKMFDGNCSTETVEQFLKHAGHHIAYVDHIGSMAEKELLEMMWFAHRRYGCEHFIIDSLMRIEGLEEDYPAQGKFVQELQTFAKQTGCHVHLVAHLGKPPQVTPKGFRPAMYAVKGSSLLVNSVDNIILLQRNMDKMRGEHTKEQKEKMHDVEIIIEKQRATGWTDAIKLKYHSAKRTFSKM